MKWIQIHENDNVAVALQELSLRETIPQGHKFALREIEKGEEIVKYGFPIGAATKRIEKGGWVHIHNVKTLLDETCTYEYDGPHKSNIKEKQETSFFNGYIRKDGRCAVRNEVWIIATVGCVNSAAEEIAARFQGYEAGTVDGVYAITHPYGCSQMGEDQENTLKALAAMADHPNAGGVLLLGLGCENCNFEVLKKYLPETLKADEKRIKWLQCQDAEDEIEVGVRLVQELVDYGGAFKRQPISADRLVVGFKCGGSDGLSGITANPLVGAFSDRLCAEGGSALLTEVPEMFGAEKLLLKRCKDRQTFEKTVQMIYAFKEYFRRHQQVIYENPSPGNKTGGITTLEDKSLGCVQKGGNASVRGVLNYGERITANGLNLLSAPGNDLVASTALALSGAHIILFTTGRGTPFGGLVPTVKIASNHELYTHKKNWIDYDAAVMLDTTDRKKEEAAFYRYVLAVASGEQTKSERKKYRDLAIFKQGVTL